MTIERPDPEQPPPGPTQYHVTYEKRRVNHILHLLLSIVTFGLWLPIWLLISISAAGQPEQRRVTTVYNQPPPEHEQLRPLRPLTPPPGQSSRRNDWDDDAGYDFDNTQPTNWLRLGQVVAVFGVVTAGIMALGGTANGAWVWLICVEAAALAMWLWGKRHDRRVN